MSYLYCSKRIVKSLKICIFYLINKSSVWSLKMPKKLIFFVKDFIVGGVEQVLVTTLNELSEQGYEILVVWTGYLEKNHLYQQINPCIKQLDTNDIWHLVEEDKPKFGVKKIMYVFKKNLNLYLLRNIGKYIPDFENYDYLIDFKNGSSKVCNIKSYPHQKKIVWIHGAFSRFLKKNKFSSYKLLSYDKIVCLTESFKQQLISRFPNVRDKVFVVRNPFDIKLIQQKANENNAEIKNYQPYFLHVSRIVADKDIQTMLKAYKDFYERTKSSVNLVLLGNGDLFEHYQNVVKRWKLQEKIFLLGNKSNPFQWMKNAEALILSSFNEGLPTVLIEGQICQTMVISSDCEDGPDEILENGDSGILFEVSNAQMLSEILQQYQNKKIDKAKYINKATQHINRFDKSEFITKVNQLLRD